MICDACTHKNECRQLGIEDGLLTSLVLACFLGMGKSGVQNLYGHELRKITLSPDELCREVEKIQTYCPLSNATFN